MNVPSGTSCTVVETGFPSGTSLGSPVYVPSTGVVSIEAGATSTVPVVNDRA